MTIYPTDEKAIFIAARQLASADARHAYIERACGEDGKLRARVESLLRVSEQHQRFLESPAELLRTAFDETIGEAPGTVIGPYHLLEQIGEGGFGVVFVAEQQPMHRKVALKVIKPGMDTRQVIARFEVERQALAMMDHPNIARVFDAGTTNAGRPYFVMELVPGVPITEYCDRDHLPVSRRLELFVHACQAVQHAHQKGIIHRDIKPSNLLITLQDGSPVVKIIDFGIAKTMDRKLTDKSLSTEFAALIGTPLYMSPEQAEMSGLDVDTRADIYALGVLLYELLTGTTPFDRQRLQTVGIDEIRRIIREEEPLKPSTRIHALADTVVSATANRQSDPNQLRRLLRGELDWIVMKCLEKDRTRRYETANGLARDIERYLNDEPVEAGPPSAGYRLRKLARKHRKILAATGAFSLLLTVAAVVSTWLAVRATMAERAAGVERDKAIAQKERGDNEAAISNAVIEFLQTDLLGQADVGNQPAHGGRRKDISVRELLDRASKRIDTKFQGQQVTEAAIRSTLGRAYLALGEYSEARKHMERAVTILKGKHGEHHPDTLGSTNDLATVWWRIGEVDKAEALYKEVLAGRRAQFGDDHFETLQVLNNLAMIDASKGRYDEAQSKFERVVAAMRAHLGAAHPKTLAVLGNLASLYSSRGDRVRAEALNKQVVEGLRSHPDFGSDHPRTLYAVNNLAIEYLLQAKYEKAQPLLEGMLKARRAVLEPGHPDTLTTMNDLAVVYQEQGLRDRADPLFREALKTATNRLAPDHPLTLKIKNSLATLCAQQGRHDEAEILFEQVLQARRKSLTPDHPETLLSLHNLGVYYRERGQYEKAEPLLVEAVERGRKVLTIHHPSTQRYIENLAGLRDRQDKLELAEPLRRELASYFRDHGGPESPAYAAALVLLADNLCGQEKYADAEAPAREALAIRIKKEPDLWKTFDAQSLLGCTLMGQQKYADAEPLLLGGYRGLKAREDQVPQPAQILLTQALERLVQLYDAWDKKAEADKWRKELEARKARPKS